MLEIRPYRETDFDVLVSRRQETNLAPFAYVATEQRHTLDDARAFFRESIGAASGIRVAEEQGNSLDPLLGSNHAPEAGVAPLPRPARAA